VLPPDPRDQRETRPPHLPNSLLEIIREDIRDIPVHGVRPIPLSDIEPRLPYPVPPKIWCIGLNYKTHAEDINAVQPEEPAVS
jgi:2-keto-4-pentenoate hydratase/2-oxohepta-3-ene-1,7-dioic acid hydratase in catechol pathway